MKILEVYEKGDIIEFVKNFSVMLCSQPIELKKGDLVRVLDVIVQPSRNGLFDTAKVELVLAIEVKDRNSEPTIYTFTVGYAEHYKFFKKNNTAPVLFNER